MKKLLLAASFLFAASAAKATQYYMSPTGTGTACTIGSPCSATTAFCGIQCTAFNPQPDDIIWVRGGTYTTDTTHRWFLEANGTLGHNIVYRAYQNEHPKFDCNANFSAAFSTGSCLSEPFWSGAGNYNTLWGLEFFNSSTQSRITADDSDPTNQNEVIFGATGMKIINCIFRDQVDGLVTPSNYPIGGPGTGLGATGKLGRGNYMQYSGYCGTIVRCYGHSMYLENLQADGEAGRSTFTGNIGLRAFDVDDQHYSTSTDISYITDNFNASIANGHAKAPTTAWPAISCCADTVYYGTSGSVSGSCNGSTKNLYANIIDSNFTYSVQGITVGGSKGECNSSMTNNLYAQTGGMGWLNNNMFAPWTFTGNTIFAAPNGSGGPTPLFTQANYPTNTYNVGFPGSGKTFTYHINDDEAGRGYVMVMNYDLSANVTINLDSMGGFAGEQYNVYNIQWFDPWDDTKAVATGICTATCGTISVSATTANIYPPAFTTDGTTPWPVPSDLGPRFIGFIFISKYSAAAGTPTPTNTPTNTPVPPTNTFTPTLTFTPTPTPTPSSTPVQNTPTFTNTATKAPTFTPTPTPTPGTNSTFFSVSTCTATAPMTLTADSTAFGGTYAQSSGDGSSVPATGGFITCTFSVPADGVYRAWFQTNTLTSNADSMYVVYDSDTVAAGTHVFDMSEFRPCDGSSYTSYWGAGWTWIVGNDRESNCFGSTIVAGFERSGPPQTAPTQGFTLTIAGNPHTLKIYNRENGGGTLGGKISYVILTTNFAYDPSQTFSSGPCIAAFLCTGSQTYITYSCGAPPPARPCPQ